MQPLNEQQAQRVWSRVLRAQAVPAADVRPQPSDTPEPPQTDTALTAQELLPLLEAAREACAVYAHLAARMSSRARQQLRAAARQQQSHARTLAALSFLLTGQKPRLGAPARPCVTCISQTLRERYMQELAEAERCAVLSARAGSFAEPLRTLAAQKTCLAGQLLTILQTCL